MEKEEETQVDNGIIRIKRVLELTGVSKTTLYRMMKSGEFPNRVRLGSQRAVGWYRHEIAAWLASRPRADDSAL